MSSAGQRLCALALSQPTLLRETFLQNETVAGGAQQFEDAFFDHCGERSPCIALLRDVAHADVFLSNATMAEAFAAFEEWQATHAPNLAPDLTMFATTVTSSAHTTATLTCSALSTRASGFQRDDCDSAVSSDELRNACRRGNLDVVRRAMLQNPAFALQRGDDHDDDLAPLLLAVTFNQQQVVREMLQNMPHGVDLNSVVDASDQSTALHQAAFAGFTGIARDLIDAGASLDARDNEQRTPLMSACDWNRSETAKLLVLASCDVDAQDVNGDTALHIACARLFTPTAQALLELKADPTAQNSAGDTALHTLVQQSRSGPTTGDLDGHLPIAQALIFHNVAAGRANLRKMRNHDEKQAWQLLDVVEDDDLMILIRP